MRTEVFETPGPLELRVRVSSSDLEVETWPEPTTRVDIDGVRGGDAARELVDAFTVELRDRPHAQEVTIEDPRSKVRGFGFREARASVRVRCPEGASITATSGSAEIRVRGVVGQVEAKTGSGDVVVHGRASSLRVTSASGDVEVEHVTGQAAVSTASGDVTLGRVDGSLSVTAVSGDVELRDARSGASVQSVSGDVDLDAVGGGDIRCQTVSGDVRIGVAAGTAVWIDASTVGGDLRSELEIDDRPPADAGDGATVHELRVRTVSGDALLTRSARPLA